MLGDRKLIAKWGAAIAAVGAVAVGLIVVIAGAGVSGIGTLTPRGCIDDDDTMTDPAQGEDNCGKSTDGLEGSSSVVVSRDGTSVYVASEGSDAIVRFKRDTANGALTPKGCVDDNDTGDGQGPDDCGKSTDGLNSVTSLALSSDGKWPLRTTARSSASSATP